MIARMASEPAIIRAVSFFDGQNLFHSAKAAFGYPYPNYDPVALTKAVCATKNWHVQGVRFYSGVPDAADNPFWNHFWTAKCAQMGRQGVEVCTRRLRYRNKQSSYLTVQFILFWMAMRRESTSGLPSMCCS